ncbi:MAG: RNA 2',3'-cyclic phosphodiesterase [Phycisphaeraceae bacterium]|nr:RNA 2',3'-cyclic phosphodiesterase [Phycisphaeraceae bacterium]MBX3406187.1 RNA 2',3'-cyclic phosphodiesterase [Phycisphaeraceae bacterium]
MSGRRPVMRLFVAAYPPPESAAAMLDLLRDIHLPERRAVAPEQVHMTLQFIGDTDERQLDHVTQSVERATSGIESFELTPKELLCLPERGDPRLVALTTDAPPGLLEIQRRLAARLARTPRDRQGFLPHITLCRFRPVASVWRVRREAVLPAFPVRAIHLMESILRPEGAKHREVARHDLAR